MGMILQCRCRAYVRIPRMGNVFIGPRRETDFIKLFSSILLSDLRWTLHRWLMIDHKVILLYCRKPYSRPMKIMVLESLRASYILYVVSYIYFDKAFSEYKL